MKDIPVNNSRKPTENEMRAIMFLVKAGWLKFELS